MAFSEFETTFTGASFSNLSSWLLEALLTAPVQSCTFIQKDRVEPFSTLRGVAHFYPPINSRKLGTNLPARKQLPVRHCPAILQVENFDWQGQAGVKMGEAMYVCCCQQKVKIMYPNREPRFRSITATRGQHQPIPLYSEAAGQIVKHKFVLLSKIC